LELCSFSGYKIYPGHGKRLVKVDGKVNIFINKKCSILHLNKSNPRKICWTVLYRRKHKKGIQEETTKKRVRKVAKFQRAIVGASLTEIMAKRNQKPEIRKAQREQAIKAAKEKSQLKTQKKVVAPRDKIKSKASNRVQKQAPRVTGKR
ncbi:unnamed protein product, partial [Gordionus sp. m RMFG-2023]